MRIVGLDGGARRVGVAVSDELGVTAQPLATLKREPGDDVAFVATLRESVGEPLPDLVVIGLPLRLDGTEGGAARHARRLAELIEAEWAVPTRLWDERMTSVQAERVLREAGSSASVSKGGSRRKGGKGGRGRGKGTKAFRSGGAIDRMAAAIILQSYLDAHRTREEP
jgi:putative Holliday junction resolvase